MKRQSMPWGIFADGKDVGARYTSWADAGEMADKLKKQT